jgi:NTE family protein
MQIRLAVSCAVPGVGPPVTIGERRFMDGGMRTIANADLAHGYQRVVIVAPVAVGIGFMASPGRQAAALAAARARVALVRPDRAAVRAIGRNVLDVARRAAVARAGWAQAAAAGLSAPVVLSAPRCEVHVILASDLAHPRLAGEPLEPLRRPVRDCLHEHVARRARHGT